jgi:hypothetical protein
MIRTKSDKLVKKKKQDDELIYTKPTIEYHTYVGAFDNVLMDIQGTDAQDAKEKLLEWMDKYTRGYTMHGEIKRQID